MKKILKIIIVCVFILQTINISAQQLNTSQMNNSGQSAEDTKARYILGLVRNNNVEALDKYFNQFPWDIQAKIDVYKNSDKKASVSIFCVAVDLGLIDVVKTFIKYGYGPADLCDVRTFTKVKQENITKAEIFLTKYPVADWFYVDPHTGNKAINIFQGHDEIKGTYTQVAYSTVTSVKDYFVYPLDFAGGEMFNYLFAQGFRSDNLLNMKALQEASRLGRQDIVNYIFANMPKNNLDSSSVLSDEEYAKMIKFAQEHPGSLAYFALVNGTLRFKTSEQAKNSSKELENSLRDMEVNMQIKSPSDTLGYAYLQEKIKAKEAELAKKESAYQAKINKLREDDLKKIRPEHLKLVSGICKKGTKERNVYCSASRDYDPYFNCNLSKYEFGYNNFKYIIHCDK